MKTNGNENIFDCPKLPFCGCGIAFLCGFSLPTVLKEKKPVNNPDYQFRRFLDQKTINHAHNNQKNTVFPVV
jgi:hypothetical protein